MGPDFRETEALQAIGRSSVHSRTSSRKGLPGAAMSWYLRNGGAPLRRPNPAPRRRSMVEGAVHGVEINPVTMETAWGIRFRSGTSFLQFSREFGATPAQRNTLSPRARPGAPSKSRLTKIVWELRSTPCHYESDEVRQNIYRSYRVPYDWVPQLDRPIERAVVPPHPSEFRIEPN